MDRTEGTAAPIKAKYRVIGVMSGSSLDGMDLALCELQLSDRQWSFRILRATTVPYEGSFKDRLIALMNGTALDLARMHMELGSMIGNACRDLLSGETADLIASHGHTLFHKPDEGLTTQIGCGATIAAITGITTVCDLRSMDVALGGQGAPLVPIGEKLLFPDQHCFINLGGISNISVHHGEKVIGYDIGPCNMALNLLAEEAGKPFDEGGAMAASGEVITELLERLDALPFYQQAPPRSLGREWFEITVEPLITNRAFDARDRMRTTVEHMARQLAKELDQHAVKHVLITGGGAHNTFLLERLKVLTKAQVEVPAKDVVDLKEALIFALLGVLRWRGEVNALASVTGASRGSSGGAVYWRPSK